ncbi:MAG TPA: lipocalin family protein [Chitinophagaceae bacterium]|nr:lipocalin family protein [Chitinophagaceae bacterium]
MKHILAGLLLIASLAACKKGGGAKSKTELLTQSTWRFDNAALDVDGNGTPDSPVPPGFLQSCDTDNTLTFKSDNTGVVDEGATRCDPAGPQTIPFTWTFKDNEQSITLSNVAFGGLNGDVTLKTLNDTQLELHKDINVLGTAVNVIVYLKH